MNIFIWFDENELKNSVYSEHKFRKPWYYLFEHTIIIIPSDMTRRSSKYQKHIITFQGYSLECFKMVKSFHTRKVALAQFYSFHENFSRFIEVVDQELSFCN